MWRYLLVAFLILMGVIEIVLALNKPIRDEILKNSPIQKMRAAPVYLFFAGLSAFVVALGIIFYTRFF
ncbi:MAG TPA: hypothetical protein VGO73_04760 [Pyrinomonadaceae bacterium]|nr:hypothetical protein [Pyrinomonadaceae bacterium]